jgi:hypothetical protein
MERLSAPVPCGVPGRSIAGDDADGRFPLSPRIRQLKAILDKLKPATETGDG